jgi:peptide/nickel transport system permease protein
MIGYIGRRLIHSVLVVVVVSIVVFLLIRALPGDPIDMMVSSSMLADITPEQVEQIKEEKGLNGPLIFQYFGWAGRMLTGDFGVSITNNYDINKELPPRIGVSLILGLASFVLGCLIGPVLGILCAVRRGKFLDNFLTILANIGITAPVFWIAIFLMYIFAVLLRWVPLYGYTAPLVDFGMFLKQAALPIAVGALGPVAGTTRQMRSSVLEVLGEDYIRTAWAKGLNERKVLLKHVLKNSLLPIITMQGQMLRGILGGSAIVEMIFVIPGMGKFMIDAMQSHDYTVVQGVTVIMTVMTVACSLLVDMLYVWVDPRIQYD